VQKRERRFVHGFDDHAVDALGPAQRVELLALRARDHQRVHFSAADRGERLLGFVEPRAQLLDLLAQRGLSA